MRGRWTLERVNLPDLFCLKSLSEHAVQLVVEG